MRSDVGRMHRTGRDIFFASITPDELKRLPPREREAVLLRRQGYPWKTIAQLMGITWRGCWQYEVNVIRRVKQMREKEAVLCGERTG